MDFDVAQVDFGVEEDGSQRSGVIPLERRFA
jgi:hypothetical protein